MPQRAGEDPQRRRRRTSRCRQDLARRGAAVPGRHGQPARDGRGGHDRHRLGRRRAQAADVARASLAHLEWQGRKINLVDAPGDPGSRATRSRRSAWSRARSSSLSGVMGVEVGTNRAVGARVELDLSRVALREHARPRARRLLPRARLRSPSSSPTSASPIHLPIGSEHELTGIVDLLHMCAYMSPEGGKEGDPVEIPAEMADQAAEYREKLLDAVVETDEALMERYLDGRGARRGDEVADALKTAVTRGELFPVACGVATKNLGTHALLDLLVEGVPSPAKKGAPIGVDGANTSAFVFKTIADPFAGRINLFRVLTGAREGRRDARERAHARRRSGSARSWSCRARSTRASRRVRRGRPRRRREAEGRRRPATCCSTRSTTVALPSLGFPEPVMSFAITPKAKGDEEKVAHVAAAARRGGPDAACSAATSRPASSCSRA